MKTIKKIVLWWFSTWFAFPNGFWGVMGCIVVISFLKAFTPFAAYIVPVIYVAMVLLTIVGGMYIKDIRKEIGKG